MVTNISLITLWVTDQDEAKRFYVDKLGFVEHTDARMGEDFRWVTVVHPAQPELEVTLRVPGPSTDDHLRVAIGRALAEGSMGGFGLHTDDCVGDHERLSALGVEFVQPPVDRPYGIEAVLRDNSGNLLVLAQDKP